MKIYRQALFWFDIEGDAGAVRARPLSDLHLGVAGSSDGIYGFPLIEPGGGLKVATEQYAQDRHAADGAQGRLDAGDRRDASPGRALPAKVSGRCLKAVTCLYTVTPDSQFIIDRLPGAGG